MKTSKELIILGAGLTGLLLARRLKEHGVEALIVEARGRPGGRIFTRLSAKQSPVEMGATWFGPQHVQLRKLLDEFRIPFFEQHMRGESFFEPFSTSPPQQVMLPPQAPSYRIAGGSGRLISTLAEELAPNQLLLNEGVTKLSFGSDEIIVSTTRKRLPADLVVSTIPPALLTHSIKFHPQLPQALVSVMTETHTWMQDAIKVALVYAHPFWRERQLSGTLFSNVGPINELYDHTDAAHTNFSLMGFVSPEYTTLSPEHRQEMVISQLQRTFGKQAGDILAYEEVVWATEVYTKAGDAQLFPHQNNGHPIYSRGFYENRLFIAGTETATSFAGYMEGAVVSAESAVAKLLPLL